MLQLRLDNHHDQFLVNPFGLLYHEVSAGNLLKVNTKGVVLNTGSSSLGFNAAGFTLHSAVHNCRQDLNCVIHVHTPDVVAVSTMECGLLPISQESMIVGDVSYHPYEGILVDMNEKKNIQDNLGPVNKDLFRLSKICDNHRN